jgi:uncharacterized protein
LSRRIGSPSRRTRALSLTRFISANQRKSRFAVARSLEQTVARPPASALSLVDSLFLSCAPNAEQRNKQTDARALVPSPHIQSRDTSPTTFISQQQWKPQNQKKKQASAAAPAAPAAGAAPPPKHLLLNYSYVPDILERRGPHREAHLAGAQKQLDAGKLVCAGAVGAPPKGATFFFKGASKEEVEAFVAADAYVKAGLVTAWAIEPYTVVVGDP